jgi:hypothetical protein
VVSLIDRKKMDDKDKIKLFELAYGFLLERFEYYLDDFENSYGSIIIDDADSSEEVKGLFRVHRKILEKGVDIKKSYSCNKNGTPIIHRPIKKVFENLSFQKDDTNNCLQIADLVASAFSLEYNVNNNKFSYRYKQFLRKDKNGKVDGFGIKVFPK